MTDYWHQRMLSNLGVAIGRTVAELEAMDAAIVQELLIVHAAASEASK